MLAVIIWVALVFFLAGWSIVVQLQTGQHPIPSIYKGVLFGIFGAFGLVSFLWVFIHLPVDLINVLFLS